MDDRVIVIYGEDNAYSDELIKLFNKEKTMTKEEVNKLIVDELTEFTNELLQKNEDYNNSLHKPNIFGQEPIEGLKARMSDKFNRIISKGFDDKTEDSMRDLFGYYIHYCIMKGK